MSADHVVFRAALNQFHNRMGHRLKRAERRTLADFLADDAMVDLAYEHFRTQLPADVEPDPAPGPTPPRPTPILDKLGQWFKWIIENQDQVIAFFKAALEVVMSIVLMFVTL